MSIEMQIPKDFNRINNNNLGELIWWSIHLNICPEILLSTIDKVGDNAKTVREFNQQSKNIAVPIRSGGR
jgi:hypothetical protein